MTELEKVLTECFRRVNKTVLTPEGLAVDCADKVLAAARRQIVEKFDNEKLLKAADEYCENCTLKKACTRDKQSKCIQLSEYLEGFKAGCKAIEERDREYFEEQAKHYESMLDFIMKAIKGYVNPATLWKDAQGEELPAIDREVVALVSFASSYKVVFAHRPNPDGWDGRDIDTGEITHYETQLYDKGGWNQPNVKLWLDCSLPNIED